MDARQPTTQIFPKLEFERTPGERSIEDSWLETENFLECSISEHMSNQETCNRRRESGIGPPTVMDVAFRHHSKMNKKPSHHNNNKTDKNNSCIDFLHDVNF